VLVTCPPRYTAPKGHSARGSVPWIPFLPQPHVQGWQEKADVERTYPNAPKMARRCEPRKGPLGDVEGTNDILDAVGPSGGWIGSDTWLGFACDRRLRSDG